MIRFMYLFILILKMPGGIRKNIVFHFLKRLIGLRSTDHQTIWTSFLYFVAESNAQITMDNGLYRVSFFDEEKRMDALIRGADSSDIFAFFQVFIAKGYQPLRDFLSVKLIQPKVVVDAGANVGYFSLLMANKLTSLFVAIEPEITNYNLLKRNILLNGLQDTCNSMHKALWTHKQELSVQTNSGLEWAVQVSEGKSDQSCLAISLPEIIMELSIANIDLLKMDIEGTEGLLFKNELFLESLGKVKVIAMEIHDKLANRKLIHSSLHEAGFEFFEKGELTLAWNKKLVNA